LLWGLRAVAREVVRWRALAQAIPDDTLRDDALHALDRKRANIDGAALFWTLPRRRDANLLRALVAYEVMADFLDCASERGAHAGIANGLCLHRALRDALDDTAPAFDYYLHHPWKDDGGYLRQLIFTCQQACVLLPSFGVVRPFIERAAGLTEVLALNHEPDPWLRDSALSAWAQKHSSDAPDLEWFEWCGGASAWLTVFALLAHAADRERGAAGAKAVYDAYLPWVSLAGTMLDSYVDWTEDTAQGAHSYVAHYPSRQTAVNRIIDILGRAKRELARLPDAHRHAVIVGCMTGMYLSKDSARAPTMLAGTEQIAHANGAVGYALVHVLRAWRVFYKQQSA
jgi:tetraprenyl-beta-curcumene synthase